MSLFRNSSQNERMNCTRGDSAVSVPDIGAEQLVGVLCDAETIRIVRLKVYIPHFHEHVLSTDMRA